MRDIHCHILPGVDDGARGLDESLAMLAAAKANGVTSIVCTPHCRDPYFDYEGMWEAFEELRRHADGFPLQMGFEVNVEKLRELGVDEWADRLHFDGSDEFLLELSTNAGPADFKEYERVIYDLQRRGYTVIVAHPERYRHVQRNIDAGRRLIEVGCRLQASADFVKGGRLGREKRPAKRMLDAGMYSYIASDAHVPLHYEYLGLALRRYRLRGSHFDPCA